MKTNDSELVERLLGWGYVRKLDREKDNENMTSRKLYIQVAEVFNAEAQGSLNDYGYVKTEIVTLAERMADIFGEDNPRFDRDRFLKVSLAR